FYVELQRPYERGDTRRNARLQELAETLRVPTVATGDVHSHHLRRARLQDALVAIRNRTSLDGCERERRGNHESVLLSPAEMVERPPDCALEVRGPGSPRHALPPGRGRGSSVGSIVCYLTGLSHVDPVEAGLSLGRFINEEMVAVPDIDLDFPRDIREKLIVRVTEQYGRERAALVASFATYRSRGAIRDIGKALGLPFAELQRLARVTDGWD